MAIEIKQHIELHTNDPLDAFVSGYPQAKAYLVANLARLDGVDAAVEQYAISPAQVHAALAFYYDHQQAIQQASDRVMQKLRAMGMQDMSDFRAEIQKRKTT